jgi:hypothetical protein
MSNTDQPEVPPSTVLDAREGFIKYLDNTHLQPDDMFAWLVDNGYVTQKFFVEMASQYGI